MTLNIDFTKNVNSRHRKKLKRIANLNDLSQLIKLPTCITETSHSLIDLVFTNVQHRIKEQGVIPIGLSDHLLIYCVFKGGVVRTSPKVIEFRSFKTYNKDAFVKDLINVPWHVVFNNPENVNDCVYVWIKLFTDVMNEHPPMPWMTLEIAKLISDWDFYLKKAKGDKSSNHWMKYKNLRNDVHRHIEKAKSDYYNNILQECRGDSAKLWKAFNQVLPSKLTSTFSSLKIDDTTYTTAKSIADGFNKFFVSIGNTLTECFLYHPEPSGSIGTCNSTFTIAPITSEFVFKYITQLNSNEATGSHRMQ